VFLATLLLDWSSASLLGPAFGLTRTSVGSFFGGGGSGKSKESFTNASLSNRAFVPGGDFT